MKKLSSFFIVFGICFLQFQSLYADDTTTDFNATKGNVNALQTVATGLPSDFSNQRGILGDILSKMFDANGKIGNFYLKAIGTINANSLGRWNGSSFVTSVVTDNGTNVGI